MGAISNSADVFAIVNAPLKDQIQEHVIILTLNGANDVIGTHVMAIGSDTEVTFPLKLIVRQALLDVACGVVLVHNHPSGNVRPSAADIKETEKLRDALKMMEMKLIDHVIVSDGKWFSFADEEEHSI